MKTKIKTRKNKISMLKLITSIALAMILCLGTAMPAIAAGNPIISTEPGSSVDAAITKKLVMPVGTTVPEATFTFNFSKVSYDFSTDPGELAKMPDLGDEDENDKSEPPARTNTLSVTYSDTSKGDWITENGTGFISVYLETGHIFENIEWTFPGVYEYEVTEQPDTYTATPDEEWMSYSGASYRLVAYVENDGNGGLYVKAISAIIKEKDESNQNSNVGDKVDPTPGDPGDNSHNAYSRVIFTNKYLVQNGGTDVTPENTTLAVGKTVVGGLGSPLDYFKFDITVTTPVAEAIPENYGQTTFKAYVVNDTTNPTGFIKVTSDANVTGDRDDEKTPLGFIEFTSGEVETVYLKHGQKIVFLDLPVGSRFEAQESPPGLYLPSYVLTLNGSSGSGQIGELGEPFSTGIRYVNKGLDLAAFTNTFDISITPTGISMNDLPYMIIIGLALAFFAAFVIIMYRKSAKRAAERENQQLQIPAQF